MQKLYRVFIALIISLGIFVLAFMTLSLDARIGKYEIYKQSFNESASGFLSKVYEENIYLPALSNSVTDQKKEGVVFRLSHGFDLEDIPLTPITYYAPSLKDRGLIILNSVLVPDQNNLFQNFYAPNLGSEQLLVNLPRHFLLPGQNDLTLMSWKTEASRRRDICQLILGYLQSWFWPLRFVKSYPRYTGFAYSHPLYLTLIPNPARAFPAQKNWNCFCLFSWNVWFWGFWPSIDFIIEVCRNEPL